MDGPEASTVAGGHVRVQSLNSVGSAHLPVLLVHVVGAGTRVVSEPDAEVLDLLRVLLVDLLACKNFRQTKRFKMGSTNGLDTDNLASSLLDLPQTAQEVPETGLGDRLVGGEDGHAVHGGGRVGLRGQVAPDNLIFLKTTCEYKVSLCSMAKT